MRRAHDPGAARISASLAALSMVAVLLFASCASQPSEPPAGSGPPASGPGSAPSAGAGELDCVREGYPCTMDAVDPAVYELEATYMERIQDILAGGSFADALAWVREQPGVVDAEADDRQLAFRLEGGRPLFVIDSPIDGGTSAAAPSARLTSSREQAIEPSGRPAAGSDVVGRGTRRDNPQNRKAALFIEPYRWELGPHFDEGMADLRTVDDYRHAPNDVLHLADEQVTPATFAALAGFDAIFVMTHGGNIGRWRWIASGQFEEIEVRRPDRGELCRTFFEEHFKAFSTGLDCNYLALGGRLEHGGRLSIILGTSTEYFQALYPGGLEKSIIYLGGCGLLKNTDLAATLAGSTSAFFAWDDFISVGAGSSVRISERAAAGLLAALVDLRRPVGTAYEAMKTANLVHDPGNGSNLVLFDNGDASKKLRMYDPPTPRDPRVPASVLQGGAELQIRGTAGDGINDQLEIAIQVTGVVDPEDVPRLDVPPESPPDPDPTPGGVVRAGVVLASFQEPSSPESLYDLRVFLDDERVAGDNLGELRLPDADAVPLDDRTFLYTATIDLPFDVEPDGMDVKLKVEVDLPEGGISDYEVDVVLVAATGATITVGGETWEFQLAEFLGGCQFFGDENVNVSGFVGGDVGGTGFWAALRPSLAESELSVEDRVTGQSWMANYDRQGLTILRDRIVGQSQIDELYFDDGRIWGSATFIDTRALWEAYNTNGTYPSGVKGTFEIRCAGA